MCGCFFFLKHHKREKNPGLYFNPKRHFAKNVPNGESSLEPVGQHLFQELSSVHWPPFHKLFQDCGEKLPMEKKQALQMSTLTYK